MKTLLFVAFGGAIGSSFRYLVGKVITTTFPLSTMLVNILGCFLIGLFYSYFAKNLSVSPEIKAMCTIGICGGFTTFSTFVNDCNKLMSFGEYLQLTSYLVLSLFLGLIALWIGQKII